MSYIYVIVGSKIVRTREADWGKEKPRWTVVKTPREWVGIEDFIFSLVRDSAEVLLDDGRVFRSDNINDDEPEWRLIGVH